jgi:hypothetical protein
MGGIRLGKLDRIYGLQDDMKEPFRPAGTKNAPVAGSGLITAPQSAVRNLKSAIGSPPAF